jgi:hypothetical protein
MIEINERLTEGNCFVPSWEKPTEYSFDMACSGRIGKMLKTPLLFELSGSSFVPSQNLSFYVLRHPVKQKIYEDDADRSWKDGITFEALQELAGKAVIPENVIDSHDTPHDYDSESSEHAVFF